MSSIPMSMSYADQDAAAAAHQRRAAAAETENKRCANLLHQRAQSSADCELALADANTANTVLIASAKELQDNMEASRRGILDRGSDACETLGALMDKKDQQYKESYIRFRDEHRIDRPAETPDYRNAILACVLIALIEGVFAGSQMAADGKLPLVEAFIYGIVYAAISITISMTIVGYFGCRYLNYRARVRHRTFSDALIRLLALMAVMLGLLANAVLLFVAARIRVTGNAMAVFDFTGVNLLSTFQDGMSLVIIAIGVASIFIATRKGYAGISDPYPGYTAALLRGQREIDEEAELVVANTCAANEAEAGQCEENLEAYLQQHEDRRKLSFDALASILSHNNVILADCAEFPAKAEEFRKLAIADPKKEQLLTRLETASELAVSETLLPVRTTLDRVAARLNHELAMLRLQLPSAGPMPTRISHAPLPRIE